MVFKNKSLSRGFVSIVAVFMVVGSVLSLLVVKEVIQKNYSQYTPKTDSSKESTVTPIESKEENTVSNTPVPTVDSDPIVNCNVGVNCGSKQMRKSECSNAGCCQLSSGWYIYTSKTKCDEDQKNQTNSNSYKPTSNTSSTVKCSYSGDGYQYDFGTLSYDDCNKKTTEYWNSKNEELKNMKFPTYSPQIVYTTPSTSTTGQVTNVVDSSLSKELSEGRCRQRYQLDSQAASSYGGTVGSAMLDMAKSNFDRCMSSGVVVAVPPPQTAPITEAQLKICQQYSNVAESIAIAAGCPASYFK